MKIITRLITALTLVAAALAIQPYALAADAALDEARSLIQKRDARRAYDLLSPLEAQRAGDPEFDYLLGLAALDSGQTTRAIFALERVLAVNPNHPQARAEIARAYFVAGESDAAKREFETVRSQKPPADVVATIDKFLAAIEGGLAADQPRVRGFLEVAVGHDSNVNQATSNSQIAIPAFGGVSTLAAGGTETSDSFVNLAGGVSFRYPFSPTLAAVGGAYLSQRLNFSEDDFNTGTLGGNLGVALTQGDNVYTIALQGETFRVDDDRFRNAVGGVVQWQRNISVNQQFSVYGQYTDLHYPDQNQRDAHRYVGGVAYGHAFTGSYDPIVFAGAYVGKEDERHAEFAQLGHDLYGFRLGGQLRINPKLLLFGAANYEKREYGGTDAFFLRTRDDDQSSVSVGASFVPLKNWSVIPQVAYIRNKSNIVIYDYDRTIVSVAVRRDFE